VTAIEKAGTAHVLPVARSADPDSRARTHLANERTFLAWFRTGFTLVALGVAASHFLTATTLTGARLIPLFSSVVVVLGVGLVGMGGVRYFRVRRRVDQETFSSAHASVAFTSIAALALGVLALIFIWLTPQAGSV
jgi:putative membrane protein